MATHPSILAWEIPWAEEPDRFWQRVGQDWVLNNDKGYIHVDKGEKEWVFCPFSVQFSLVAQSCLTLRPHGLQHARPPCPSPTPGVYSNSCPLSRWCHPTISPSVIPSSLWPSLFHPLKIIDHGLTRNIFLGRSGRVIHSGMVPVVWQRELVFVELIHWIVWTAASSDWLRNNMTKTLLNVFINTFKFKGAYSLIEILHFLFFCCTMQHGGSYFTNLGSNPCPLHRKWGVFI